MAVTKIKNTTGGTAWIRLSGTIQEVLDALAEENASALNVVYWSDDGTNAKAVFCREH